MSALPTNDPRRAYPPRPVTDGTCSALVGQAVASLVIVRAPMYLGDACAELHALLSLAAEIRRRVPGIVQQAHDQTAPWSAIARQLGLSAGRSTAPLWGHIWALMPFTGPPWVLPV